MDSRTPTAVFNTLAAVGFILLLVTIAPPALSKNIHRSKTWFSMILSWMVYSASYLLIIGHQMGPEPPRGVCGLQMLLVYATPPLTAISGLAFIADVHLRINKALFTSQVDHKFTPLLLLIPWGLFVAVTAEALIVVRDFSEIQRDPNNMYCHSVGNIQTQVSAIICVIGLGLALCMEIWTSVILYRNWVLFRQLKTKMRDLRLSSLIRILVFTLMTSTGLGLGAIVAPANVTDGLALWSALLPILPVLCAISFGTQMDIVHWWMFWRLWGTKLHPSCSSQSTRRSEEV
ncbi:hypothetical protein B0H15DRAFT_808406 [Mycena belliarum]|uniref:Uncharacterized protein n=1 Tax=Mycena belliarum TaxID=1033014 RepID=A0AAD6UJ69_9AGAR|nr:hypothetical protein B0H15DRAFT_808406 [Mycena belliae]